MTLIVNDALTPVRTRLLIDGVETPIIIPGRGWRRVSDDEMTDDFRAAIARGDLRVNERTL